MSLRSLLDTKTQSLNEILSNGRLYFVPLFQRDYSWGQDHWDDLWSDIVALHNGQNSVHYMGSIVLQIKGNPAEKQFWIIDGQQRLCTLSLLVLAAIEQIKKLSETGIEPEQNSEREKLLLQQYIGHKDAASLLVKSKIKLNENNDNFYQQRLVQFKTPVHEAKLSDSEQLLWQAYQFFRSAITQHFNANASGAALASFITQTVGESLQFIQITVEDELNAFQVFETLNARGEALTPTDLLKNYLFYKVANSEHDLLLVKIQWKKIIDRDNSHDRKLARYTLYAIEAQIESGIKTDFRSDDGTIEHILPENMNEHWRGIFTVEAHERTRNMLGNLTLLEPKLNQKQAAQHSFDHKMLVYSNSQYALTNTLKASEWSPATIRQRQSQLAKLATAIWKL